MGLKSVPGWKGISLMSPCLDSRKFKCVRPRLKGVFSVCICASLFGGWLQVMGCVTLRTTCASLRWPTHTVHMLDCLYKCFLCDRGGFVSQERFDCLMQPLTDQEGNIGQCAILRSTCVAGLP